MVILLFPQCPNILTVSLSNWFTLKVILKLISASFYGYLVFTAGGIGLILVIFLFIDTIKHVLNTGPAQIKTYTFWVLVIYPVKDLNTTNI